MTSGCHAVAIQCSTVASEAMALTHWASCVTAAQHPVLVMPKCWHDNLLSARWDGAPSCCGDGLPLRRRYAMPSGRYSRTPAWLAWCRDKWMADRRGGVTGLAHLRRTEVIPAKHDAIIPDRQHGCPPSGQEDGISACQGYALPFRPIDVMPIKCHAIIPECRHRALLS